MAKFKKLDNPKVLDTTWLALMMQVHRNTIRNWVKEGMPHTYIGGRLRFDLEEVVLWHKRMADLRLKYKKKGIFKCRQNLADEIKIQDEKGGTVANG